VTVGKPLRLLAVHQGGGIGGAPVSLVKLLATVDPAQVDPTVLFTEAGPMARQAALSGVRPLIEPMGGGFFYSAHARLGPRNVARFLRTFPRAVQRARWVLREERPDLLHLNTSVLVAWGAAARHERVPVVWMVREVLGPNLALRQWHATFLRRHARRLVAISNSVRECFPDDARIDRVYNAVDLADFRLDLLNQRATVRAELGLAPDEAAIMALGSVQREKGHWLLLDALEQLRASQPRARLVLVCGGVGPEYAKSWRGRVKQRLGRPFDNLAALLEDAERRGLRDRVLVTGFRHDVARVLTAADVVAFPSLEPEGFGRPLIEAMAMRRPVVATHVGPSAEILGPGTGLLVQRDAGDLAHALDAALASPERQARMGELGRQRVEAHFGLATQVAAMQAIYREAYFGA
jgi:glycosyltransferase involved in cell wall biosynthesis